MAVVQIHLVFNKLIAPENDTGLYLPHKKTVFLGYMAGYKLLHREIK